MAIVGAYLADANAGAAYIFDFNSDTTTYHWDLSGFDNSNQELNIFYDSALNPGVKTQVNFGTNNLSTISGLKSDTLFNENGQSISTRCIGTDGSGRWRTANAAPIEDLTVNGNLAISGNITKGGISGQLRTGVKRFAEYIAGRTGSGDVDGLTYIDENDEVNVWGVSTNNAIGIDQSLTAPGTTIPLPPEAIGVASKVYRSVNLLGILTTNNEMYFMGFNEFKLFSYIDDSALPDNPIMKKCSVSNVKKICFGPYTIIQALYYVTNNGKLYAAGRNYYGVLGNGLADGGSSLANAAYLTQGPGSQSVNGGVSTRVKDAVLIGNDGNETGLCLFEDGTVKTVGYGGGGQIGVGTTVNHNTWQIPVEDGGTTALSNIVDIQGCGYDYYTTLYALDNNGVLWGWGSNAYGELSTGNQTAQTKAVTVGTGIITDFWACGGKDGNALFVKYSNNKIYACGNNSRGQLGLSTLISITTLQEVTSLPASYNIKEIIMSGGNAGTLSHTYAVTEDDRILVSGNNIEGQCSMGTTGGYLSAFEFCYTTMNNSSSLIKLKSGISRNNPYIDLKYIGFVGGNSWVLSNNNEAYTCGTNRFYTNTITNELLFYLTRAKHWL